MRRAIVLLLCLAACGGPDPAPAVDAPVTTFDLPPATRVTASWSEVNGAVVCPGASSRQESDFGNGTFQVRCLWACADYTAADGEVARGGYVAIYIAWIPGRIPPRWEFWADGVRADQGRCL